MFCVYVAVSVEATLAAQTRSDKTSRNSKGAIASPTQDVCLPCVVALALLGARLSAIVVVVDVRLLSNNCPSSRYSGLWSGEQAYCILSVFWRANEIEIWCLQASPSCILPHPRSTSSSLGWPPLTSSSNHLLTSASYFPAPVPSLFLSSSRQCASGYLQNNYSSVNTAASKQVRKIEGFVLHAWRVVGDISSARVVMLFYVTLRV